MYFFHNFNTFYFLLVNALNYMYFSLNQKKTIIYDLYASVPIILL